MSTELDPLTILLNANAKFLEEAPVVKRAMGLARKNIHAFNKSRGGTAPDIVSESDVPEIIFEAQGGPSNINRASNLVTFDATFNLMLNSGDQRVTHQCYPVLWAVFALYADGIVSSALTALQWRSKTFVRKYELLQATLGQSNPAMNRGIKGWTAICQLTFHLHFAKGDISAFIQGT